MLRYAHAIRISACLAAVSLSRTVVFAQASFQGLGDLPGGEFRSGALAVSAGGAVVGASEADAGREFPDCNGNGIDDAVEIDECTSQDCNENGIPDECDIEDRTSQDCQANGIPDECDLCSLPPEVFSAEPRIGLTAVGYPVRVLWWDSTPEYGGQALDAYRKEMSDYLTAFGGGGIFEGTYVSSEVPGTFAVHMSTNDYDVIVFDATSSSAKFNQADLDVVVTFYYDHPNVLLDGTLYIRSINFGSTTDFPGINESTGKFTVNEVYQLGRRCGGIMVGTDHSCCQVAANQVLGAVIPSAVFTGITTPSFDGQFNGDDLLNAIAVASAFDIFQHWAEVPSQAIAPTGDFLDIREHAITLYSQVDVADFVGGPKHPYISTSWEPGGICSMDSNENGIPDECECLAPDPPLAEPTVPDAGDGTRMRYLSWQGGIPGIGQAVRVTLSDMPTEFSYAEGRVMWVGQPRKVSENAGVVLPSQAPGWPTFWVAPLQCEPYAAGWSAYGSVHVYDESIVPNGVYDIQIIYGSCDPSEEGSYSARLPVNTSRFGDLIKDCTTTPCGPPDGIVNVTTDVTAVLDKFKNLPGAPGKSRCDVEPDQPDFLINITDVVYALEAFKGFPYTFSGPPVTNPCE